MYYHIIVYIGDTYHLWWNYDYDSLARELLTPFINKQVIPVVYDSGNAIFNFATATYIRIFKTPKELIDDPEKVEDRIVSKRFERYECTQEIIDQFLVANSPVESRSLLQTLFMPTKRQVFVVMKFGDKLLDSAYEGAIKPVIKRFKYKPLRIDEIQDSGRITNQILEEIAQSEIVIADLTGERPNCYYEAGFAHAIGKEIIFTIRKDSAVHFDLAGYRFIEWETESELRKAVLIRMKAIENRMSNK